VTVDFGPSLQVVRALAIEAGACIRPILQKLTDTETGQTSIVPIRCGATLDDHCPGCAERNRQLRIQQCREGWHLTDDPLPPANDAPITDQAGDEDQDLDDDQDVDESSRRVRSTRRRQDVPDLPRLPVAQRTIGATFTGKDGKTWRPSTFLTLTLPSYGPVHDDGTPLDPERYDYRRAALDALHGPKLWDRFVQNLRRAAGYRVQYFAVVEPQQRLAAHWHAAIRGAIPRRVVRQVVMATYHQLWWPAHCEAVYTDPQALVWQADPDGGGRYIDEATGTPLPTWDEALDQLDQDLDAKPAHVLRFGVQLDIQGLIGGPKADRRIGYLTKYLTKSIASPGTGPDATTRQQAHAARLQAEVRWLPCSPSCWNWLRYGITPKGAKGGEDPGWCAKRAHKPERLGCGGRRVLVSDYWTGKALTDHVADRLEAVRVVLERAGMKLPAGCSATEINSHGKPRWTWEPIDRGAIDALTYRHALMKSTEQRLAWREQYEQAKAIGPPARGGSSETHQSTSAEAA
jgi:hypothetical protein